MNVFASPNDIVFLALWWVLSSPFIFPLSRFHSCICVLHELCKRGLVDHLFLWLTDGHLSASGISFRVVRCSAFDRRNWLDFCPLLVFRSSIEPSVGFLSTCKLFRFHEAFAVCEMVLICGRTVRFLVCLSVVSRYRLRLVLRLMGFLMYPLRRNSWNNFFLFSPFPYAALLLCSFACLDAPFLWWFGRLPRDCRIWSMCLLFIAPEVPPTRTEIVLNFRTRVSSARTGC